MVEVVTNIVVIQNGDEIGHPNSILHRFHAHGQLVAEVAHGGQAHAGDAHVLAQCGCGLHIELVERDDAVDLFIPRQVR